VVALRLARLLCLTYGKHGRHENCVRHQTHVTYNRNILLGGDAVLCARIFLEATFKNLPAQVIILLIYICIYIYTHEY
jgi:hypothetical protein